MLRHYLRTTLRAWRRTRTATFINIIGLAVGLACCGLIALYVQDELTHDRFHDNVDRIALLTQFEGNAATGGGPGPAIAEAFSQVEAAVRLWHVSPRLLANGDTRFNERGFIWADPTFFDVFTHRFLEGAPETALDQPGEVVLTASAKQRLFGDAPALGQTVRYENAHDLTVSGVIEDVPGNSHLSFDYVGSMHDNRTPDGSPTQDIYPTYAYTYLLLAPGTDPAALEPEIQPFLADQFPRWGDNTAARLHPLTDLYLTAEIANSGLVRAPQAMERVVVFVVIGLFILLLAGINYVNLATARAGQRAGEIGVRKALGAHRTQLVRQFLAESLVTAVLAAVLALLLVELLLPVLNHLTDKALNVSLVPHLWFIAGLLGTGALVGLLAGVYPAFLLSNFRPVLALRGGTPTGQSRTWLRKGLVVVQFAVAIALVGATFIALQQLRYIQTRDLGFDREQVVVLPLGDGQLSQQLDTFKDALEAQPAVQSVTATSGIPGASSYFYNLIPAEYFDPEDDPDRGIAIVYGDADFVETMGLRVKAGRDFDEAMGSKMEREIVLNEQAVAKLRWDPNEVVGREFGWTEWPQNVQTTIPGEVIGVIEDYNHTSLHDAIPPMMLLLNTRSYGSSAYNQIGVRLRAGDPGAALAQIEQVWQQFSPDRPFEYTFLDQQFDAAYRAEQRVTLAAALFAGLAVFIACLGLFGLAAFVAERRTKEIGVRKVLGASRVSLVALLSRDFARLVLVAAVLGGPLAWWAMQQWLEDFAFRITINPLVLGGAALAALAIALLTVSTQALRVASANPVDALRSE